MELMTDDIIEIKKSSLFSDEEVRILTKRLTQFQYRLNKGTKQLSDFKEVIKFEEQLLREAKLRKSKKKLAKIGRLEIMTLKRIQFCYDRALTYFSDDFNFNMEYLEFLNKNSSLKNAAAVHVKKMIEKFQSEPAVFQKAALWYKNNVGQVEAVRVLLRGLAAHPADQHLYLDLIEAEMTYPDKIKEERFKQYIDNILIHVPDFEILIYILSLLEPHAQLTSLMEYIMDCLTQKYPYEEKVWHVIAIMELKGYYYQATPEDLINKSIRHSIQRCIMRYEQGIAKLPFKKKPALWKYYLDTLIDLQKENPNVTNAIKADSLKALQEARAANIKLDELHWKAWIDLCGEEEELLMQVLADATMNLPSSTQLWLLYLKLCLLKKDFEKSDEVFERAIKAVGHKASAIWDMYITAQQLHCEQKVEGLLKRAALEPYEEVSKIFKIRYLNWCSLMKEMRDTRMLYFDLALRPPYSKELHQEMLKLERMEIKDDFQMQVKIFELYAKQFGHQDVEVWIDWISTLSEQKSFDENEQIAIVYKNAIKCLPEVMANEFREKYNDLHSDLVDTKFT
ncbi:U3 small nucleolar RNA-associated protein 6 homolog [Rhynchophorus ferrugineus]|uniref:U3 small nucleolar RNA-associated protein 6 homolog n=1 Tax=Rhynchophorus ferrugineus TaxID=354439 RepID=UPI003FCDCED6